MNRLLISVFLLAGSIPITARDFQTFEGDGYGDWQIQGDAFGLAPSAGKTDPMNNAFTSYSNDSLAISAHGGDAAKGSLLSPEFTIGERYISFLIAGGDHPGKTAAQLLIDGKVVREAFGKRNLTCQPAVWDVTEFIGKNAKIRLIDDESGEWGIIGVDHIIFGNQPNVKFPSSTREGKAYIDGLSASNTLAGVNIPVGSILEIEATHKDQKITSPTAITFDDLGRVFVAETHRFREGIEDDRNNLFWYLDDLAANQTSDRRALHEKWKAKRSIDELTRKSEVIRRLSDTDGDGKLDESTVFADGFNDMLDGTAAGVFYYDGCLYFACIPKIYMLRDTNGDGKSDERKVVEQGFGVRVSLSGHDLNGFTLGPDGRIYGTIGDRGMSVITKEGRTYHYPNEGAAFRFEPDGSGFELFHTGLRNPKEIAFDTLGNAFSVDNNSDQGDAARIVYLVEGGDSGWQMEHQAMHTFHRQIGLAQRPPSRWMDERMWELENSSQPAFMLPACAHLTAGPSGLTFNPGVGFLENELNRFLVCDYRGGSANSGVWSFQMEPKGAGMGMSDSRQFLWGVAATDVEYSWDGRVFISDFITGWESHEAGRILSLNAEDKPFRSAEVDTVVKIMREGFAQRNSRELFALLSHRDARIRLRAQIALARKPDGIKQLSAATESGELISRVHGIWGLGMFARRGETNLPLIALLKDRNPEIRSQVLRVLADSTIQINSDSLAALLADESPRVRFFAAIFAGKRKASGSFEAICNLLRQNNNGDVYLRHAGVFALQHLAINEPGLLAALTSDDSPAVRLAATVALRRMNNPDVVRFISDPDSKVADEAIRAICDNDMIAQRPAVSALLDTLDQRKWTPFMLRRMVHNAYRIGSIENAERLLKVAAAPGVPDVVRKEVFRLLSAWTEPFPVDQLTGHWRPLDKRSPESIRPALSAALPRLLRQQGLVLSESLKLVAQYKMEIAGLDSISLKSIFSDSSLPSEARTTALKLFIQQKPQNLNEVLSKMARDDSDQLALTALSAMAGRSPEDAVPALDEAIRSSNTNRAQRAWGIIATIPGEKVDTLLIENLNSLTLAEGVSPFAVELTSAAATRTGPAVKAALATFEKSLLDSADPLAKWNASLQGGDATNGAAIFASHPASECMRCHRAEDGHSGGGETAPNLAGIANRHKEPRYFLESMVNPSAVIAPGFGSVLVEFKNGANLSGNLVSETPDHLTLDSGGKHYLVNRSDIASFNPPVSPMPPMGGLLNPGELRDVVAWLVTLNQGGESEAKVPKPVPLDPATLEIPVNHPSSLSGAVDPVIMKTGKQQFLVCGACHGQSGEGTAAGPPLAGSEWVLGPEENLIKIQLRGLVGPITVKGQEYNFPGGMAALAYQTDEQIASVLTYIRNSFGNSAPPVAPAAIAALRSEVGKPQITAAELIPPLASKPVPDAAAAPTVSKPSKYDNLKPGSSLPKWVAAGFGLLIIGLIVRGLLKNGE
jgi:quinoprotein glucose dehydrogenase